MNDPRLISDLQDGEIVVHSQFGLGRYWGTKRLTTDGREADYLDLEFAGKTRLHVPVERLDLILTSVGTEPVALDFL
jgi:transcription-repair coupling factor (superfamily II helicase)